MTVSVPVRLAFVGCGRATTELHLPALRRISDIEVAALCDVVDDRLRLALKQAPRARIHGDIADVVADTTIDAVAVCTPPSQHARHAIAVLDAGKHLFVEKPLALTMADCDAILARGARSARHKVIGLNLRQHRLLRAAREVIASGTLGRVELARGIFTTDIRLTRRLPAWRDTRTTGGGVLFELATHHFDLWRWLLGDEVVEISALSRSGDMDDAAATVTGRLRSGALASLELSERTTPKQQIEVLGERGRLRVSLYDFDGLDVVPSSTLPGSIGGRVRAIMRTMRALPAGVRGLTSGGDYTATYEREWRSFADTLLRGAPPAATLEDGRAAARIAIAAAESAATGRAVNV